MQKAQVYLERHLAEIGDVYTVAITAYVLQLVGSSASTQAFRKLEDLKISGNSFVCCLMAQLHTGAMRPIAPVIH